MTYLFVGGSGRSGTSAVVASIGESFGESISSLNEIELKLFNESGGLTDLYHAAIDSYNFNRLHERVVEFRLKYKDWLFMETIYGQTSLSKYINLADYEEALNKFLSKFSLAHIEFMDEVAFAKEANDFLKIFFGGKQHFLEKTPHLILDYQILNKIFPDSIFIAVLRNPSSTLNSMKKFNWGFSNDGDRANWINKYYKQYSKIRDNFKNNVLEVFIEDENIFSKVNNFVSENLHLTAADCHIQYDNTSKKSDMYFHELANAHKIYDNLKNNNNSN